MADIPDISEVLRTRFGHGAFLPGQEQVAHALLSDPGRSALAVFPTGGGKSLTYQLPAVVLWEKGEGTTLVVSPLVALMKDQIDALGRRGIPAARLDSTLGREEALAVERSFADGGLALLYVSPERFNNERFLALLGRARVALFAVDEAHCISEWGHAFRPDYLKLAATARRMGVARRLALTATATPRVREDVCEAFGIAGADAVVTRFHRANLRMLTTPVAASERDALLLSRLRNPKRPPGATIVYVTRQAEAEETAARLALAGLPARAYHAGMATEEREAVQEWWMGAPDGIAVATVAFGMGVDRPDVRYVYHRNLPKSVEGYSQEIGRAGRDGGPSVVEMLACPEDVVPLENFAHGDAPHEGAVSGVVGALFGLPLPGGAPSGLSPDGRTPPVGVAVGPDGELALDLYALSRAHDLRQPVLRTLLTYLELDGHLRQLTPAYAGYRVRRLGAGAGDQAGYRAGDLPGWLAGAVLDRASFGRSWWSLDAEEVAGELGVGRSEVVEALDGLAATGGWEVKPSGLRHRYAVGRAPEDPGALAASLQAQMLDREVAEVGWIRAVVELVMEPGCQANRLSAYFGQPREEPCGACSSCAGVVRQLPEPDGIAPPVTAEEVAGIEAGLAALRAEHPAALGAHRQATRFLCGVSSPALSAARLHKHSLYGVFAGRRFHEVHAAVRGSG